MKRWNAVEMLDIGKKLFAKIHKKKHHAHHKNIRHRHDAAITTANDAYNLSENGG